MGMQTAASPFSSTATPSSGSSGGITSSGNSGVVSGYSPGQGFGGVNQQSMDNQQQPGQYQTLQMPFQPRPNGGIAPNMSLMKMHEPQRYSAMQPRPQTQSPYYVDQFSQFLQMMQQPMPSQYAPPLARSMQMGPPSVPQQQPQPDVVHPWEQDGFQFGGQ